MFDLTGRVAVITGAASGIGEASARAFAAAGALVVVADLDEAAGARTAAEIGGVFVRTDVTIEADIEAAVNTAVASFGRLDIMWNNAGAGGSRASITDFEADDFDRTMAVLLRSVALGLKHAARVLRAQGDGGVILATASVAGIQGGLGPAAYSAAKGGVIALTRAASLELAPDRIRVNAIAPGGIVTNFFAQQAEAEAAARVRASLTEVFAHAQPLQRAGQAEDVAAAGLYLAADAGAFITGQVLVVDGGKTGAYGGAPAAWRNDALAP